MAARLARLFDAVRNPVFGGRMSPSQVAGVERLLREGEKRRAPREWAAYVLATAAWETGRRMQPVEEGGKGRGHAYGKPDKQTGVAYYGRGDVQLTWKDNYAEFGRRLGIDLLHNPELALDPDTSAEIIWEGMIGGLFRRGHSLPRYFPPDAVTEPDTLQARQIVNGIPKGKRLPDRAEEIAGFYRAFLAGLSAAGWPELKPARPAPLPPPDRDQFGRPLDPLAGEQGGPLAPIEPSDGPPERPEPGTLPTGRKSAPNNVQIPHGQASGSIEAVQRRLKAMGYHEVGELDGKWGGRTAAGIAAFMNDRQMTGTPAITPELLAELDEAEAEPFKRPIAPARAEAQAPQVAPKLETVNASWWSQATAWLLGLPAAAVGTAKAFLGDGDGDGTPDVLKSAYEFAANVPSQYYAWAVAGACAVIAYKAYRAKKAAVTAYQEGRLTS